MDDEDHCLEEGEISDDSDNYTPLERPESYATTIPMARFPVVKDETESEVESSSDSGSDSDNQTSKHKWPKLKPRLRKTQGNSRNQKYNIWSTHMQEIVLADTLNTCDVTIKDRSRDVESYDYSLARSNNKRSRDDRKNNKLRLVGVKSEEKDDARGAPRELLDLAITFESTEEEIAKDLANKLFEEKEDLILKIINVIGKEKAVGIYQDVKRIEKEGGMLIMNQSRRRTPGGVYLFLVKHDDNLTQEQRNKVFEDDRQRYKEEVKSKKKEKHRRMKQKIAASINNSNLPELLTRAELCVENLDTDRWRAKKKETEHPDVTNPPPTPETDCHENSGDGIDPPIDNKIIINEISGRCRQDYDEDFLDLGTANDMDLF